MTEIVFSCPLCQVMWSLGATQWRCQSSTETSLRKPSMDASLATWLTVLTTTCRDRTTALGIAFCVGVCVFKHLCAKGCFHFKPPTTFLWKPRLTITIITNNTGVIYLSSATAVTHSWPLSDCSMHRLWWRFVIVYNAWHAHIGMYIKSKKSEQDTHGGHNQCLSSTHKNPNTHTPPGGGHKILGVVVKSYHTLTDIPGYIF